MFTMIYPRYFPELTYFKQISLCTDLIYADHFKHSKTLHINRFNISKKHKLVVPLSSTTFNKIKHLKISSNSNWQDKHIQTIKHTFHSFPYFDELFPQFELILNKSHDSFLTLILELNRLIMKKLRINPRVYKSTDFASDNFEATVVQFSKTKTIKEILINNFYLKQHLVNLDYLNKFVKYKVFDDENFKLAQINTLSFLFNYGPEAPFAFRELEN